MLSSSVTINIHEIHIKSAQFRYNMDNKLSNLKQQNCNDNVNMTERIKSKSLNVEAASKRIIPSVDTLVCTLVIIVSIMVITFRSNDISTTLVTRFMVSVFWVDRFSYCESNVLVDKLLLPLINVIVAGKHWVLYSQHIFCWKH